MPINAPIPDPISVAPFTGLVTLPFSIRYASDFMKQKKNSVKLRLIQMLMEELLNH
mgnify:CR=1 FL=1